MKTFETYSRGLELIRAIRHAWICNEKETGINRNKNINARMVKVKADFNLTWKEYYYWTKLAS